MQAKSVLGGAARAVILALALCVLFVAPNGAEGRVIELGEENFEHLTQAATGATTGDWFVKFYAPWCGHCKRMASAWQILGEELLGEINVAEVNAENNKALARRFEIKGFPTLLYFHQGTMYKFRGRRDVETMAEFARYIAEHRTGPEDVEGVPVPAEASFLAPNAAVYEHMITTLRDEPLKAALAALAGVLVGAGAVYAVFRQRDTNSEVPAAKRGRRGATKMDNKNEATAEKEAAVPEAKKTK
ncbi:Protein disulfide-isomerase [Hondaea fermentalgiana]|uniref:Protein disulfide-isomerase n=1 Tax=Hondaea fermentalgiana TaxID=2315210 RepID=A0A2R5GM80_9STRA|nr:Protein disulfide-isomerase [Hondaea fermentalgiana]|eukprot:GBG31419.1 Protein disulfide-isomerase [Hondaea fermentalgiana]